MGGGGVPCPTPCPLRMRSMRGTIREKNTAKNCTNTAPVPQMFPKCYRAPLFFTKVKQTKKPCNRYGCGLSCVLETVGLEPMTPTLPVRLNACCRFLPLSTKPYFTRVSAVELFVTCRRFLLFSAKQSPKCSPNVPTFCPCCACPAALCLLPFLAACPLLLSLRLLCL